ncbi:transposase [Coraliomargarita parva]|uniref:transposase n=1 Tax=Coraliomargarita parva TaxID=3014050 RepID=UPI0022B2CD68|nr:transposase [Coraliomargarita parva]
MPQNKNYIAVDIAKDSLQVQAPDYACALSYNDAGLKKLGTIIRRQPAGTILVCEATGGYERSLIGYLHEHGLPVALLNPARVRNFARSEGLKAKTDPLDAKMLLRYASQKQPGAMPPPCPCREELAALMDRRSHLTEMLAREKCRQQNCPAILLPDIAKMIGFIESELKEIERRIREKVRSNEKLKAQSEIMQSVTGVGPVTAWSICAYLGEITQVNRAQVAALAGLAPYNHDTGKTKGKRRIQGGRQKVRDPLYMAATAAAVHNEHIKAYMDRLRFEKGKPYKWAITAAMRKLLIHIQSLLKNYEKQLV